jgi:hypothetical protein
MCLSASAAVTRVGLLAASGNLTGTADIALYLSVISGAA